MFSDDDESGADDNGFGVGLGDVLEGSCACVVGSPVSSGGRCVLDAEEA